MTESVSKQRWFVSIQAERFVDTCIHFDAGLICKRQIHDQASLTIESCMAKLIVLRLLLLIRENFIRLLDLHKLFTGSWIFVGVGMVLLCKLLNCNKVGY